MPAEEREEKSVADFDLRPLLQGLFRRSRHRVPRQFEKWLAFFFPQHDWLSCVSADADFRIERQLRQEVYVHLLRRAASAAVAEHVDALVAVRTIQPAHVL